MATIDWEERIFQLASSILVNHINDIDIETAIEVAQNFKEKYIEKMSLDEPKKEKKGKEKDESFEDNDDFVETIYSLYPAKCPKRGTSLGKSTKDKDRIRKLLKTYTKEQIEMVIRKEIGDKYGISYMQNFSTFLNNFPDPTIMEGHSKEHSKKEQDFVYNGVIYK
jgi:hypothetical protein